MFADVNRQDQLLATPVRSRQHLGPLCAGCVLAPARERAYRHAALDQPRYLLAEAKNFREREQRLRNETKQGMWWRPLGNGAPRVPTSAGH